MRRHAIRPGAKLVLAFSLVAGLVACTGDELSRPRLYERLIATEPTVDGTSVRIYEEFEVFRLDFRTPEDIAPWQTHSTDLAYELTGDGLYIRSSTIDPFIWRDDLDFDAAEVDRIRIRHSGLHSAAMQIFWAGRGEPFSEARSMTVTEEDPGGTLVPYYSFDLSTHPEWKGRIQRFRIDPTSHARRRVELFSLTAYGRQMSEELLAEALATPVKAELGDEARNALLAPPGRPITMRLTIPPRATLHFAYGLQQNRGPAVEFRVFLDAGTNARETIFAKRLDPAIDSDLWRRAEVDLQRFAGREASLVFETEAVTTPQADASSPPATAPPLDLRHGFPLWAHPEVWTRSGDPAPPLNVVVIVVDTLRADHMSLYGYERPTTPHITAWAERRGVVFENVVAPAPWTLPSHVSLFTGLGVLRHGVNYTHAAPNDLLFLAEKLRQKGWATAAFTGGAFVSPSYGLAQGFDVFRSWKDHRPGRGRMAGKDLEKGLERALAFIDETREPFFLFFHTYETHAPYVVQNPWYEQFHGAPAPDPAYEVYTDPGVPSRDNGWRIEASFVERLAGSGEPPQPLPEVRLAAARSLYDSGIAHADAELGRLFDHLQTTGLEERTLILFTSDHGEGLGEHDSAGHSNLYDFNLLVPLVIALPDGAAAGQRIATQVRLVDVTPTVLEALGLDPLPGADGRSLLPLLEDPGAAFPREAVSFAGASNLGISLRVANRSKLIYPTAPWAPFHGREEFYDVAKDPGELVNLADEIPGEAARFRAELERRFAAETNNLRVRLANHEDVALRLVLRGKLAHAFRVKGFELPCCVRWEKGETRAEIAPGEEIELYLEGATEGDLKVGLASLGKDGEWLDERIDVMLIEDFTEPWRLTRRAGRWHPSPSEAPAGGFPAPGLTGLEIRWHGRTFGQTNPAQSDKELREQLKALGYLH